MTLRLSFWLWLCVAASAQADNGLINISQDSIDNLGIKLGKPVPVSQLPVLSAPAKIIVPPGNAYVVSATQAGVIIQLTASVGDSVKKGDVLATINSPGLLALQQQFLKAGNDFRVGLAAFNRDKKLFDDGVIAERRWQETAGQFHSLEASLDEARQLLEISGMPAADIDRLNRSHRMHSLLSVRAPIAGTVLELKAANGEHVDTLAPLYHLANLQELWLEISVPQEKVHNLKPGDTVLIDGSQANAKISLIGQSVNPQSQTVTVRAVLKNEQAGVFAGQKANVQILQNLPAQAFKVPNTAVAQNEGKNFIFLRNERGFMATEVNVIGKQDSASIITGNLSLDAEIAVSGAVALKASWLGLGSDQ
ncbi:MAG: efflux transporter periplasmic adaptor subunit [Methylobacter sp.]|nr:MAG: efflux transporter periplasmic adaptor subunit [Methylobacter sp.]PPD35317.1 MAG: efflux transporter periplasmic adaptor subunit [Methylomonas sp.]